MEPLFGQHFISHIKSKLVCKKIVWAQDYMIRWLLYFRQQESVSNITNP